MTASGRGGGLRTRVKTARGRKVGSTRWLERQLNDPYVKRAKAEGYRVTLLAFLVKAAVSALRQFPEFNSSLSPEKDSLILKSYYNVGIAVDTPDGLVVPVVTGPRHSAATTAADGATLIA